MNTLDLIDKRIRHAASTSSDARVDIDDHLTPEGYGHYYRIRQGDRFKPLLTIDVEERRGLYHVRPKDVPWQSRIDEVTRKVRSSGDHGFLADELDEPLDALEAYIKAVVAGDRSALDEWHTIVKED